MRADAAARRSRIIDTACTLFRTTSPHDVTMEKVAARAQVGIATVYRNFADRNQLILECMIALLAQAEALQDDIVAHLDTDVTASWRRYVWGLVELGLGPLVQALAPPSLSQLPPAVDARWKRMHGKSQRIISAAQRAGLVTQSLTPSQFIAELIVITRPPMSGVLELDPDVTRRLVRAYFTKETSPAP